MEHARQGVGIGLWRCQRDSRTGRVHKLQARDQARGAAAGSRDGRRVAWNGASRNAVHAWIREKQSSEEFLPRSHGNARAQHAAHRLEREENAEAKKLQTLMPYQR